MINLNEVKEGGISIFNNGEAGAARATLSDVVKKQPSDPDNAPDYKLIFQDKNGKMDLGIYVPSDDDEKRASRELSRLMHIGRAVMGKDYQFPAVSSYEDAYKKVMSLVKKEGKDKEFNVFVCYGYTGRPSMYLGLRYFNFIENGSVELENTHLSASPSDVLKRPKPDEDSNSSNDLEDMEDDLTSDDDGLFDEL